MNDVLLQVHKFPNFARFDHIYLNRACKPTYVMYVPSPRPLFIGLQTVQYSTAIWHVLLAFADLSYLK
jgi:hypothetical protein